MKPNGPERRRRRFTPASRLLYTRVSFPLAKVAGSGRLLVTGLHFMHMLLTPRGNSPVRKRVATHAEVHSLHAFDLIVSGEVEMPQKVGFAPCNPADSLRHEIGDWSSGSLALILKFNRRAAKPYPNHSQMEPEGGPTMSSTFFRRA
jgi:hypothetical protein